MKIFVIGGTGFIGQRIVAALGQHQGFSLRLLTRNGARRQGPHEWIHGDALDTQTLRAGLEGCSAVVSCVTGNGRTIIGAAKALSTALAERSGVRVVHMSSMAVYGDVEGDISDEHPLGQGGGWYANAKREAENIVRPLASSGHSVVMLRPGCVHGPGSPLWVERLGKCLQAGRLGDLGIDGDGWSNLVHVDDVANATVAALAWQPGVENLLIANMAAPDSPRWNRYLVDLGVLIGKTPVRRIPSWEMAIETKLAAVPLRIWERVAPRIGVSPRWVAPAITPALCVLFKQPRRLRSEMATHCLHIPWTPYAVGLEQSARWYLQANGGRDGPPMSGSKGKV
jgi:nucleoside-diphosphate-sugar epimerase